MHRHAWEESKGQNKTNCEKSTKYFGKTSLERGKQHNHSCAAHTRSLSGSQCNGCHSASFSNTPLTIGGGSNAYPSGCQKIGRVVRKSVFALLSCRWLGSRRSTRPR